MSTLTDRNIVEVTANEITGVYVYADVDPPEVTLIAALAFLEAANLTPVQKDEMILYLAARLAERL